MEPLILFQAVQTIVLVLFAISISDFRKKEGTTPLLDKRLVKVLKLTYLIPTITYGYILLTAQEFKPVTDLIALAFNIVGVWLTWRAKIDLGKSHTWTGYCSSKTQLVTRGIYGRIRHPLYTGIYLFIVGVSMISIAHGRWYLATIVLLGAIYIMSMLAASAARETAFLTGRFGAEFVEYRRQVHAFLPLRGFQGSERC